MPLAPAAKGIIILSGVIIAASIALYEENEQVREFVDNSARKVNEVWIDITERLHPQQRERRQTEKDVERRDREAQSFTVGPWQTSARPETAERPLPGMQERSTKALSLLRDIDRPSSERRESNCEPEAEEEVEASGNQRNVSSRANKSESSASTLYDYDDEIPARALHAAAILKEATEMRDGVRRRKGGVSNLQHQSPAVQSPSVVRSTNTGTDMPPPSRSIAATARSGKRRALYEAAVALPGAGIVSGNKSSGSLPSGSPFDLDQSLQLPAAAFSGGTKPHIHHDSDMKFFHPPSTSREALNELITSPTNSEPSPAFDLSEPHDPSATTPSTAQITKTSANQMKMPLTEEDKEKRRAVLKTFLKSIDSSSNANRQSHMPNEVILSGTETPMFSSNVTTIPIPSNTSLHNEVIVPEVISTTANIATITAPVNEHDASLSISNGVSIITSSASENLLSSTDNDGDTLSDAETETASHVSVDGDMIMTPNGSEWDDDDASMASASSWSEVGSESDL